MSLLQQDSPEQIDDAARGEEFTKGTSHVIWASIVAAILVTAAIVIFMFANEKPPAASGEILQVWVRPVHTETSGFDANGEPMAKDSFDQILVFAHVKLHNQSQHPMLLHQILANIKMGDGILSSYAASAPDYGRVFIAYPQLAELRGTPLPPETTLDPGQTQEGFIVSAFRLTKQQWDTSKNLNFTFAFSYQPSLVLTPKAEVIAP